MKIYEWIKQLYFPATCEQLIARELDSAKRSLLEAETAMDYAESMVLYHKQRIERLSSGFNLQECWKK